MSPETQRDRVHRPKPDGRSLANEEGMSRLWWWISFSGILHLLLIVVTLFVVPSSTARRVLPSPVYTVELLGGEPGKVGPDRGGIVALPEEAPPKEPEKKKLAATKKAVEKPVSISENDETPSEMEDEAMTEAPVREPEVKTPVARAEPPPREAPKKAEPKLAESPSNQEKPVLPDLARKKEEKKVQASKKTPARKKKAPRKKATTPKSAKEPARFAKKEPPVEKKSPGVSNTRPDPAVAGRVRERLISAAVERAKERARKKQRGPARREAKVASGAESGPSRAGTGGVSDRGEGRGGDGVVKGLEFLIYRNRMLQEIKERWTWLGKRDDLEVTVRFGISGEGEIIGLNIVNASGDPSYDASVLRAVRRASPLPRPPVTYLGDFSDVELTFRPKDLSG